MSTRLRGAAPLLDLHPTTDRFREDVIEGLRGAGKTIPCKYFYDAQGSRLFEEICRLDEYYPTRTETAIMTAHAAEMAACIGSRTVLVEFGSGSSDKTRILLDHLPGLTAYVPLDISREQLSLSAGRLAADYPYLAVHPVCADYTAPFRLPAFDSAGARWAVYFPGSTIGNFHPHEAVVFMRQIAQVVGPGGGLLIGVDLKKDARILEAAYNDRRGVTAAFNLNLLRRINRELGADFDLSWFVHHAPYKEPPGRIEMHLVSLADQAVHVAGTEITLEEGESILTECSYKYTREDFTRLAGRAGFTVRRAWTDPAQLFSVQYLVAE